MVNMDEIKLAFFDYDDTLCIHRHNGVRRPTVEEFDTARVTEDIGYYMNLQWFTYSPAVKDIVSSLYNKGVKLYVLTWASDDTLVSARQAFLSHYYGDVFSGLTVVGSRESKIAFARMYSRINKIPGSQILIVEDHPDTRYDFLVAGFSALSVSEIASDFEMRHGLG